MCYTKGDSSVRKKNTPGHRNNATGTILRGVFAGVEVDQPLEPLHCALAYELFDAPS
nr:unnamed protein product [Digitaria exilis]